MSKATLHIALKSGNEFEIECDEGTGELRSEEICERFFAGANLGNMEALRLGPHIFYCREIERLSFSSPADNQ